jgi:hypothetical protein
MDLRLIALLGLCAVLVALVLGWRLHRAVLGWRLGRRRRRGARGERAALALLEEAGYRVLAGQETATGRYRVDGEEVSFQVRADAIVEKAGRRLVVEIKTGAAADLATRATRRQLLEYAYVFRLDGVLLADMAERRLHRVDFTSG